MESARPQGLAAQTAVHRILETVGGEEALQHLAELRFPLVGWLRLAAFLHLAEQHSLLRHLGQLFLQRLACAAARQQHRAQGDD